MGGAYYRIGVLGINGRFIWWGGINDITFVIMRLNGTKYESIAVLPVNALPVSIYARDNNTAVGYVYIKYERYLSGKGSYPGYAIKCFMGSNYIIPE